MTMPRYRSNTEYGEAQSKGYSVRTSEPSGAFVPSLAPPYPNLEDELRKSVVMLASCIEARDIYLDSLRKKRDALLRELRMNELVMECQEARIRDYQQLFSEEEHKRTHAKASGEDK
jgi:CRISPR/Cas system-associated exonuclease Cas4 (RecB family)